MPRDPVRNGSVELEVCPPCFVDPAGERTACLARRSRRIPAWSICWRWTRTGLATVDAGVMLALRTGVALAAVSARRNRSTRLLRRARDALGLELPQVRGA